MKTFFRAIALLATLLPALAAAQGPQVNIFTFEDASCAAWLKTSGNKLLRAQYEFWMRGFVSGHNYANPSRQVAIGKFPGGDALYQYLDKYCHDNANSSFIAGAIHLVNDLREPVAPVKPAPAKKEAAKAPATTKGEPAKPAVKETK